MKRTKINTHNVAIITTILILSACGGGGGGSDDYGNDFSGPSQANIDESLTINTLTTTQIRTESCDNYIQSVKTSSPSPKPLQQTDRYGDYYFYLEDQHIHVTQGFNGIELITLDFADLFTVYNNLIIVGDEDRHTRDQSADTITVYDLSSVYMGLSTSAEVIASFETINDGNAMLSLNVHNEHLIITGHEANEVWDISDLSNPLYITSSDTGISFDDYREEFKNSVHTGDYIALNSTDGIVVYDVSDLNNITRTDMWFGSFKKIDHYNEYIYAYNKSDSIVEVLRLSNGILNRTHQINILNSHQTDNFYELIVFDKYLITPIEETLTVSSVNTTLGYGRSLYDLTNPARPELMGSFTTTVVPGFIDIDNNVLSKTNYYTNANNDSVCDINKFTLDNFDNTQDNSGIPQSQIYTIEQEPNNYSNNSFFIVTPVFVSGNINVNTDPSDFFTFTPNTSGEHNIQLYGDQSSDINLYLYNENGQIESSEGDDSNETITANLTSAEQYFVQAHANSTTGDALYTLSISENEDTVSQINIIGEWDYNITLGTCPGKAVTGIATWSYENGAYSVRVTTDNDLNVASCSYTGPATTSASGYYASNPINKSQFLDGMNALGSLTSPPMYFSNVKFNSQSHISLTGNTASDPVTVLLTR